MEDTNIVNDVQNEDEINEINADNGAEDRVKKQKALRICALAAIALTALSVALRMLSLFFFYEKDIAYYESGAALPIISNIVYALAVAFLALSAFLFIPKAQESDSSKVTPPSFTCRMAALLPAAALVYFAASSYIKLADSEAAKPSIVQILSVVFAVLSAIFFVLLSQKPKAQSFTAGMGLTFVVWTALVWIDSYIDYTVPLNSPDKLYFHFACIAAAFLVINELRVLISFVRPREYYFSLTFALLALGTSALPSITADTQDVFLRYPTFESDIVMLALFVYALLRLSDTLPELLSEPTVAEAVTEGITEDKEIEKNEEIEETEENSAE